MVTKNTVFTCEEKRYFSEINFKFATALNINKFLKQNKSPIYSTRAHLLLLLPSIISDIVPIKKSFALYKIGKEQIIFFLRLHAAIVLLCPVAYLLGDSEVTANQYCNFA